MTQPLCDNEACADRREALVQQRDALLAACKEALTWYGPDGDHIGEPWRSQLLAAIALAEKE